MPDLSALMSADVTTEPTNGEGGVVTYSFSGNENQFDYLAEGESVTITYTVTIDDNNGGSDTQDVTVTITGANDAPDITIESGDGTALALTESSETAGHANDGMFTTDGGTAVTTGTLTFSDPDFSDTHTASVTAVSVGIGEVAPPSLTEEDLLGFSI